MLKQSLQQKLQQKLSPQQIQVIRLLEVPALEMEERVKQEIEENPALEEGEEDDYSQEENLQDENNSQDEMIDYDDISLGDYKNEDDIPDYKLHLVNNNDDDKKEEIGYATGYSLHEYLIEQLYLKKLDKKTKELAEYVIGNVDQDGYLRREVESMVDDYSFQQGIQVEDQEMANAVKTVQMLEPAGICATNLQECLILQLKRKKETENIALAINVLENSFDDFSKRHYDKVIKRHSITENKFKEVVAEIIKLNPKPGSSWTSVLEENSVQLVPDFILENQDGDLILSLNNKNIPELRLNRNYSDMLEEYANNKSNQSKEMKDAVMFVKQKLDSAKWFINAVKQRQETLQRTMQAIIERQREFFLEGDETKLKPMILKDISEDTGYDISTISRVSNSKFIQTDFGIYALKYFFSETMQNDQGEEISSMEIKTILQECINGEDKRDPLTDDKLAEILKVKGYIIARRTVAKYREQLNFPVSRLRKEI
ncbi:MAG TPA: RNA polymerase factor sigma-54 [Paludibacteraceae bacterium]|nr:RNA polymerase factor sigma-54 [Paludibacteraceae bacterium]HPH63368.1 RNA polymerase factor sigma-54 [Paludibacteraceae bacterium]